VRRRGLFLVAAAATAAIALGVWSRAPLDGLDPRDPRVTLSDVEATVARRFKLPEIDHDALKARLGASTTVLFDVREPDEFAQSHLPGARRIDPAMSADDVIFYCAVGVRSGTMLERAAPALLANGVTSARHLRGGIFRWHASHGPLTSDGGDARKVHHFDEHWRKLLDRSVGARSR
jgi:rhodanese-related sulfurtransferase